MYPEENDVSRPKIAKIIFIFIIVLATGYFFYQYLFYNKGISPKSKAALNVNQYADLTQKIEDTPLEIKYVCSNAGTGCDYIGAEGIQQAIDHFNCYTCRRNGTIIIRAGTYRPISAINIRNNTYSNTDNIQIIGEGYQTTIIDGANVSSGNPVINIAVNTRTLISNLQITHAQAGNGIVIHSGAQFTLVGNKIGTNAHHGIEILDRSVGLITNNLIKDNLASGIMFSNADTSINYDISIKNNVLFHNGQNQQQLFLPFRISSVINNIIANGIGTGIYFNGGIPGNYKYNTAYNNHPNYTTGNVDSSNNSFYPYFVNTDAGDFHLQKRPPNYGNSPLRNIGDPSILDPDGSRSDIGAFGGPEACTLDMTLIGCNLPTPTSQIYPTLIPTNTPALPTQSLEIKSPFN